MYTITADDDDFAISSLMRKLKIVLPDARHESANSAEELLALCEECPPDIAFIDIEMYGMDGMSLTRKLAELYPDLNVFLYTGHIQYALEAYSLYICDYLVKPVSEEKLREALCHLRHPIKQVYFQCFGKFEVFCNGQPLRFKRKKSKELLAYLVNIRGASASTDELRCLLWNEKEDTDSKKNYVRVLVQDIRSTLNRAGLEDILVNLHDCYSLDKEKIHCDYFDYLDGKHILLTKIDTYMKQYPWAETTRKKIFTKS